MALNTASIRQEPAVGRVYEGIALVKSTKRGGNSSPARARNCRFWEPVVIPPSRFARPEMPVYDARMSERENKPRFKRGSPGFSKSRDAGRKPAWRERGERAEGAILYGWHTVAAALAN